MPKPQGLDPLNAWGAGGDLGILNQIGYAKYRLGLCILHNGILLQKSANTAIISITHQPLARQTSNKAYLMRNPQVPTCSPYI